MKKLLLAFICLLLAVPCQARTIFVDANTPDNNDGSSWAKAYRYLQDALADANSNPNVDEILVAQGIYKPDETSTDPNGSGDREAMFQLINGVALKGGYAGFDEPDPNAREIELYETILSGDLLDNDDPCTPVEDMLDDPCRADDCYHLFYHPSGTDLNATAVLDGFSITAGNANSHSYPDYLGGGMYNYHSSPTITNCTFIGNSAEYHGGGMCNRDNSSPTLTNCTFSGNSAGVDGGGMDNYESSPTITNCTFSGNLAGEAGGGMHNRMFCSPAVTNCTFSGNSTGSSGGGMYNFYSSPTLANCTFSGNWAADGGGGMANCENSNLTVTSCTFSGNFSEYSGGGMYNYESEPNITNCTFSGNWAADDGGGMYVWSFCSPTLTNCTFSGNFAEYYGGGMFNIRYCNPTLTNCTFSGNSALNGNACACDSPEYSGQPNYLEPSNVEMTNCILWDGGQEIWNNDGSTITINYTDLQGGQAACYDPCDAIQWGLGNIDADPCFVDPGYWADANDPNIIVEPNDPNAVWVVGDYHLKSEGWRWDTKRKVWTWDDVTSRCIDAGNPGSPLGDELLSIPGDPNNIWGQNLRINMGAYGGTAEASMAPYDWAILADLTNDGLVNLKDYAFQAADWRNSADQQPGDLNRDSLVYISDLALLVEDWLKQTIWHE